MNTASVALFVLFFLLLLSRMPIAGALGLTAFLYYFFFTISPLEQVPDTLFNALNTFPLMAIPFFILAANIMSEGGISRRLITAANAAVGQFRGGLGMTAVLSCMFFAAISGSSPATVVAVGTLLIPAMIKAGYGRRFGTGLIATSGSLGILIPPSITLVIYGVATEQSIGQLFIAGILPGLMAGFMLLALVVVLARWRNLGHDPELLQRSIGDRQRAFRDASVSMLLPILVLGGIYTGFFTPTEAAAMAVLYAVIISMFIYREMNFRKLMGVVRKSARMSAMVLFITANAILFTHVLATERIPAEVTNFFLDLELSKWLFLLFVNILLLILGTFMETSSVVLILAPILLPVAMELGVDPIHFGIIMIMNLEIGMITPPLGFNLVVASGISRLTVLQVAKAAIPSALVLLCALLLVTYVPDISLALLER
jgi:C4-dicarboxylate transporter, DctM subunit